MVYQGGKFKLKKVISKFLESMRTEGQHYYEPFIGGAWVFMEMDPPKIGNDLNKYVIALYKYLQESEKLEVPETVSEEEYRDILQNEGVYPDWLLGYSIGIAYGGVYRGGYARTSTVDNPNIYVERHNKNMLRHWEDARQEGVVEFLCGDYRSIDYKPCSLIYCDPPYKGVIGYRSLNEKFDHTAFWEWAEYMTRQGHTVIVSEGEAPEGWEIVYDHMTSRGIRADDIEDKYFKDRLFMFNLEV